MNDTVHVKIEVKPEIVLTGLTVGDWVEALHDFSPGHNSGGGVVLLQRSILICVT